MSRRDVETRKLNHEDNKGHEVWVGALREARSPSFVTFVIFVVERSP
jgi:hypothetical protein